MSLNALRKIYHKAKGFFSAGKTTEILLPTNNYKLMIPDDLSWAYTSGDYYEKNVIYFLDLIVRSYKKPVMFDIGANCGYYSLRYANVCSRVFSFEPVTKTYDRLRYNIKRNSIKNITALKMGLSDQQGKILINLYNSSGNNSIFERKVPKDHSLKKIGHEPILLEKLDHLVAVGKVSKPDIIKIDVEGAELHVLRGAESTISLSRPTLLLEYSENTSNDAGYNKTEILTLLKLDNYHVYGIPEDENDLTLVYEKDLGKHALANLIFIAAENDTYFDGAG